MAKNKKEVEQELKDLASIAEVAFKNISENIRDVFSDAFSKGERVLSSITSDMQRNLNSLAKDSNKLVINQSRINQGLYSAKDITKQILANEDKLYILEQQRASTIQAINDDQILSEEEKQKLIEDINKEHKQAVDYNTVLVEKLKEQETQLEKVEKIFDMTPYGIETRLKLRNPIYSETAAYGHMGRKNEIVTKTYVSPDGKKITKKVELFTWEKLDYIDKVKKAFGIK
jgi:seryl-tRNA synthetase